MDDQTDLFNSELTDLLGIKSPQGAPQAPEAYPQDVGSTRDAVKAVVETSAPPPALANRTIGGYVASKTQSYSVGGHVNMDLDPSVAQALDTVAQQTGASFQVVSGFRDPSRNAAVGGARGSQHLSKRAVDISLNGLDENAQKAVVASILAQPGVNGFGYYPNSNSIHFDTREGYRAAWGQSRSSDSIGKGWPSWMTSQVSQWHGSAPTVSSIKGAEKFSGILSEASSKTGVPLDYLIPVAKQESDFNPNLVEKGTTATGLFQFPAKSWEYLRGKYHKELGISPDAPATDPRANTLIAARYTKDIRKAMETAAGREIGWDEVYVGHFMGPTGGARLLKAAENLPDAPAADLFPDAARYNPAIFYKDQRTKRNPRTTSEVYAFLTDKVRGKKD